MSEVIAQLQDKTHKENIRRKKIRKLVGSLNTEEDTYQENQLWEDYLNKFLLGHNLSFIKVNEQRESQLKNINLNENESDEDRLLREIPSLSIFLNTVYNALNYQLRNKSKVTDRDIMNLLPILVSKIFISREAYQKIYFGLQKLLDERARTKDLISDNLSTKKRLIKSKLPNLTDEEVHNLAQKIKMEESVFGVVFYIDFENLNKIHQDRSLIIRGLNDSNFNFITNPKRYERSKSDKYKFNFSLNLVGVGSINDPRSIKQSQSTLMHEEFHTLYRLITTYKKSGKKLEENTELQEKLSKSHKEFLETKNDTNSLNSDKVNKYTEYLNVLFDAKEFKIKAYDEFLNELCAQLEGSFVRLKGSSINALKFELTRTLEFYKNPNFNYQNFIFQDIRKFKIGDEDFNDQGEVLRREKTKFISELNKEFAEINEIILRIYFEFKSFRIILFTILTTENPTEVKNRLLLLEESLKKNSIQV